jgi:hypothetical protein
MCCRNFSFPSMMIPRSFSSSDFVMFFSSILYVAFVRVVDTWNKLPANVVESKTVNMFKSQLNTHWKNLYPRPRRMVSRQFGPYLPWALETWGKLFLVREDRNGHTSGVSVVTPVALPSSYAINTLLKFEHLLSVLHDTSTQKLWIHPNNLGVIWSSLTIN